MPGSAMLWLKFEISAMQRGERVLGLVKPQHACMARAAFSIKLGRRVFASCGRVSGRVQIHVCSPSGVPSPSLRLPQPRSDCKPTD